MRFYCLFDCLCDSIVSTNLFGSFQYVNSLYPSHHLSFRSLCISFHFFLTLCHYMVIISICFLKVHLSLYQFAFVDLLFRFTDFL